MLSQYKSIKARHADCILFFRLGDFYEMFYDDAVKASRILELVLTSRGKDRSGKIPMCGVPHHAAESYIARLVKAGLKVAICEQTEDPAQAKGIVKRDVIRVISSGTFIDDQSAEPRYLLSLNLNKTTAGITFTDNAGGTFHTAQLADRKKIIETVARLPVCECVFSSEQEKQVKEIFSHVLLRSKKIMLSPQEEWCFNPEIARKTLCEHFSVNSLRGFGIDDLPLAVSSAGALLEYMTRMNCRPLRHIDSISLYLDDDYVYISPAASYGLELQSLISAIDHTRTPLGKRMLYFWVYHPLKEPARILKRQEAVTLLKNSASELPELHQILRGIPDIEKSLSRISCGYGKPRDLLALRHTLLLIPGINRILTSLQKINSLCAVSDIPDLRELLEKTINPELPLSNPEGKIINRGVDKELDSLRDLQENGNQWLKKTQEKYIKDTAINSLKIGYNKVFGYYIEISKANLDRVPDSFIRKQTLVNAERYITPELKEFEEKMLFSREKILARETRIVNDLNNTVLDRSPELHNCAFQLAVLDTLHCLALLAQQPGYTAPLIHDGTELTISDGRHPVVENSTAEPFIPNDTKLDCRENHLLIITGPNMAGKSTYIRQTALLVILAQIGSYIPAAAAQIGIVDKIFTRIGAHDEISKGQSTFMVEMSETAGILHNLSSRSLVILDEIGRGTSTYDGLSLAWAIAEYLQEKKARTLFATHYHELTALAEECPGVKNYNVAVKEWNDQVIFLHKIVPGGTDDSYGIYVAHLAGIPQAVVERSRKILSRLEIHGNLQDKIRTSPAAESQLSLFVPASDLFLEKIKKDISHTDIDSLTPLDALKKINQWKEMLDPDA